MRSRIGKASGAALLAALLAGSAGVAVTAAGARADSGSHGNGKQLAGTWRVQVTSHDCTSGAALLSFRAMLTFAEDGTLTGTTAAPIFKPGQRSPDHGAWKQVGRRQFRAASEAFVLFDSPPPPFPLKTGVQRITQDIEMGDDDRFTSDAAVEFRDTDGNVVANLCATAWGTRFD